MVTYRANPIDQIGRGRAPEEGRIGQAQTWGTTGTCLASCHQIPQRFVEPNVHSARGAVTLTQANANM